MRQGTSPDKAYS